nr:MAG TPA: hypothetical protein [Caudoviricetes sp.]
MARTGIDFSHRFKAIPFRDGFSIAPDSGAGRRGIWISSTKTNPNTDACAGARA